jgi:glycosyltransferase involved in cell wall biosynthesis
MNFIKDPAKPTVLFMSDSPLLHTGQAVVLREVAMGLSSLAKYNIVVAGWGYKGGPHNLPFPLLPSSHKDHGKAGNAEAGVLSLEAIVDQVQPDLLWTVGDIWMFHYVPAMRNRQKFKWVAYTPVDGEPIPREWHAWLKNPQRLVMEVEYGSAMMKKYDPSIEHSWIYHGCNPKVYYPLTPETRRAIKKQIAHLRINGVNSLKPANGLPDNAFVVGTLARNQPRKNYERNLKAFSVFAKDKPEALLWLHAAPVDHGYNLVQLAHYFGIQDKVVFTTQNTVDRGLSEGELNLVVNMWDVHFLPTQGEGFGIPILETMAAGVPQVVSDYTSHVEFAKKAGLMIPLDPVDDFVTGNPHMIDRAVPKPSVCAAQLNRLYADPALRAGFAAAARATAEPMTWEATIPQWDKVLQQVLG